MKLKLNDKVKVISGKDKGKEGSIVKVLSSVNKVVVAGVNIVKRHVKPGVLSKEGGIISMEKPVQVSNLMVVCEKCARPVRVGYKEIKGRKYRVCRKCNEVLDK